jgi:hypothetical protein
MPPDAAPVLDAPVASPSPSRWIIGPGADVAFFILPAVTGYLCLYVSVGLGVSSFLVWWFWNVVFNGPHFFATLSRTYLDRQEWRERTPLLVGSLALVLVGPVALAASLATRSPLPFLAFWALQVTWAYYHVTRQHYGFMALYQKLNGEPVGLQNPGDYWLFHALMFGPVLAWFLQYPELRQALGWSVRLSTAEAAVVQVTRAGVVAGLVLLGARELGALLRRQRINVPKCLLLAAYLPLHLVLLLHPTVAGRYDILLFNAVITLPHNIQYLAIVWFYNRNRYHQAPEPARYGWAVPANASLARFVALGVAFSVVFFYARFYFEGQPVPFAFAIFPWAHAPLGMSYRVSDLVAAIWIGMIFHHQYLDQRIWRISRDRQLNQDLQLSPQPAAA